MKAIPVTADQIIETLKEVVASKGRDYVYPGNEVSFSNGFTIINTYLDYNDMENPRPGCGIGHVAHRLGAGLADVREQEGNTAYDMLPALFTISNGETYAIFSMLVAMSTFQVHQDNGKNWGQALDAALASPKTGMVCTILE